MPVDESPLTRASLLVQIRDGANHIAWQEFVKLYGPVVYRFARNRGLCQRTANSGEEGPPGGDLRMRQPLRGRLARIAAATGLTATLLLPAVAPVAAADPVILKVGTIEDLRSLNPYQSAYFPDYETFQLNYQLLVDFGPKLEPIPAFADTWERAADGKSWKFHIPAGMKWSDGTPATSADACFSYGLDIDAIAKGGNVGNGYIDPSLKDARVTKAECPDAETMILYTDDGTTKILKTYIPILPKHVFGKYTWETIGEAAEFKAPMVGSGQYQVAEYTEGQVVHLKRNPNYFLKQKGFADEIFIQIFKNADTMVQELKNGGIDYARAVPVEQFDKLKTEPNIVTVAGKSNGWVELGFNSYGTGTGKTIPKGGPSTPALQDQAFRDALGYAIDKPELVERILNGYGDVASTNVPPVLLNTDVTPPVPWHTEPTTPRTFDINLAKEKLTAAGYLLNDKGQRLDKQQKVISLKLVMPDSSPTYPQVAQFIEAWFSLLGIKVTSSVIEENTLYDVMTPPEYDPPGTADYDLFIWSWYGSPDPNALLSITRCDQIGGSSDSLWCHPPYDTLYDRQNLAADDNERKRLMDELQNMFYDQAPYHLLYYDDQLDAYRTDRFTGWQNQPLDTGVPLFTYSVIDYSFLTDAKAPPSAAPSEAAVPAPSASGAAVPSQAAPAPSAAPSAGTGDGSATGSSSNMTPLIIGGALVVVGVVAAALIARRRRTASEEE
jgi:peptide/nickel transport system substrate-binding protein